MRFSSQFESVLGSLFCWQDSLLQDLSRMLKDKLTDVKPQDAAAAKAEESARKMCQEAPARGMLGDRLRRRAKWRLYAKNQEGLVAKKVAFRAVCQDALTDAGSQFRLSQGALTALQWAGEEALATMFAKASLAAKHANRMTVYPKDVRLLSRLLSDDALFHRFSPKGPDMPQRRKNKRHSEGPDDAGDEAHEGLLTNHEAHVLR